MNQRYRNAMITTLFALAAGCSTNDSTSSDAGGSAAEEPDPDVLRCADDDLVDARAFAGPEWDPTAGAVTGEQQATYTAATTIFAYHRDARKADFDALLERVIEAANQSPGLIGLQIGRSEKCGYARTISVWRNEDAMMNFVLSGTHSEAMTKVREVGIDGRTISWEAKASELPVSWPAARAQIVPTLP